MNTFDPVCKLEMIMKKKTKAQLDLSDYPVNDTSVNLEVHTVVDSISGIEYKSMASYIKSRGISESTIRRMIKSASGNRQDRLFVVCNGKYFVHDLLAEKAFRNLPTNLNHKQGIKRFLQMYNWTFMASVNFRNGYGEISTRQRMEAFFRKLRVKFSRTNISFFFVTERNSSRDGMHSHFLLSIGEEYPQANVQDFIEKHFKGYGEEQYANVLVEEFDQCKDGIGYLLKELKLQPDGYDLLTHTFSIPKKNKV